MSKEYIERGALLKHLCNSCDGWCENTNCDCVNCKSEHRCDMVQEIEEAPNADVVVLPCKPGDMIYRVVRWGNRNVSIRERIVSSVEYNAAGEWVIHSTGEDVLGTKCFLTREDAERALSGARMDGE